MIRLAPLERRLRKPGAGGALFDPFSLGWCATDASAYQALPTDSVVPQRLGQAETAKVSAVTNDFSYGCQIEPAPNA